MGLIRTFQTARIYPGMTALENVLAGAHLACARARAWRRCCGSARARREERALARNAPTRCWISSGLAPFRDMAATDLPMGGQKLLEVVRALMARPRLLLLDEPAAGLNDAETAELAELLRAVRDSGITGDGGRAQHVAGDGRRRPGDRARRRQRRRLGHARARSSRTQRVIAAYVGSEGAA